MAKSTAVPVVDVVPTLAQALKAFLDQPAPAEPTIEQKVTLLHANDLYALLKPQANQEVAQDA